MRKSYADQGATPRAGMVWHIDDRLMLLALWLVATLVNLFKPSHIDDAAHLIIAEWIASNPLHPMSGQLNWGDSAEQIFVTNQPHLYFYLMAAVLALFGPSELAMHGLMASFTLWAIVAFHALARRFVPQRALLLTFTFAISPGFLINQNSMVDVPLVAMIITTMLLATAVPAGNEHRSKARARRGDSIKVFSPNPSNPKNSKPTKPLNSLDSDFRESERFCVLSAQRTFSHMA